MLSGKVGRIFQRKNSRRSRKEETPVTATRPLSPVSENSVFSIPRSDRDVPRPVPPPSQFHHHEEEEFEHHGMEHEGFGGDMHDPHSRLYETFSNTMSEGSRGRGTVPMVVREGEGDEYLQHHPDDYEEGHIHSHAGSHRPEVYGDEGRSDAYMDELGYVPSQAEHSGHGRPILISPSEASHSSQSSGQRVTFIGDLPSQRGTMTPSMHRTALSASSRSMLAGDQPRAMPMSSSVRSHGEYDRPQQRRHVSDPVYRPRRAPRPEARYEQQLPYMIFVDYGDGLEIGNEVDGFMPYTEYIATAHLRRSKEHTYYIIPGSTPVIFHDEHGNELYKVNAQDYNTPTLRRRKYIIEDEFGKEICRIGNFNRSRSNPLNRSASGYSSGSHSSRSGAPRVIHLDSDNGSIPHRSKYNNIRAPRSNYAPTPLARSALFDDDDERTQSSVTSAPDILVVNEEGERIYDSRNSIRGGSRPSASRSPYSGNRMNQDLYSGRSEPMYDDEYGQPVDNHSYHPGGQRDGAMSVNSDETDEDSYRNSRVFYA